MLLLRGGVVQEALWQRLSCIQQSYLQGMKWRQSREGHPCCMAAPRSARKLQGCTLRQGWGLLPDGVEGCADPEQHAFSSARERPVYALTRPYLCAATICSQAP